MDKINKIMYLNLDRREDRKNHFLNSCEKVGIPKEKIERFQGLDGLNYKLKEEEEKLFINCDYKKLKFFNKIACNQLGHYYMIKEVLDKNYDYAIICQDDCYFRDDFIQCLNNLMNNFPNDAEILNIGFHKYGSGKYFIPWDLNNKTDLEDLGKNKINDNVCILKDTINPCSLAYIITKQGAYNILKHFNNNGFKRATDGDFNDYCQNKNIFYGSIPVLCTGNQHLGSDIFN